ncbi:MAG TPA: 2OG-Fe(II) oxygenase [Candidatus Dormibacteraeota bacterium]|nr:2OG-Fe(II) oxygenase [Candidatus Dormibacteraeota bacterium]
METTLPAVDFDRLEREADQLRAAFNVGDPIRHVVIDAMLRDEVARRAFEAFPSPEQMAIAFEGLVEVKNAEERIERLDPVFQAIFGDLRSERFLGWLQRVTGIADLSPDPELHGGGLHQGPDGSYLDIHADFNLHPRLGLYRRLNVLIYLNPAWNQTWGGYLELWARDMSECRASIEPILNRCVIMETHDRAFHGYRQLHLPEGTTRKSVASYYYSPHRSEAQSAESHNTLFQLRPQERKATGARHFLRRLEALAPAGMRPVVRGLRRLLGLGD